MSDATDAKLKSESSNRYLALDGLRGIAAMMIVLYHTSGFERVVSNVTGNIFDLRYICKSIYSGVDLFFVLSGFLITSILLKSRSDKGYYIKFYGRRTLRIFPLYYGVLIGFGILCLIPHGMFNRDVLEKWSASWVWLFLYLGNIYGMMVGFVSMSFGHFWSLAIEEHFYLFWPTVIKYSKEKVWVFIIAFVAIGLLSRLFVYIYFNSNSAVWCYIFTFCRIDSLAIGALLSYYIYVGKKTYFNVDLIGYVCVAFVLVLHYVDGKWYGMGTFFKDVFGYTMYSVLYAGIILMLVKSPKNIFARLLCNRILVYLGLISYSLYVLHYPILGRFKSFSDKYSTSDIKSSGVAIIAVLACVVAASLSFYLYERPFLKLKDRWFSK